LNKINQLEDKQKLQLAGNKLKKGKNFLMSNKLQDRNQKLGNDDSIRLKSNNQNQNIYKTTIPAHLNKFNTNNNTNNNETRSTNNITTSTNSNLNSLKRKRNNNNEGILTCSINTFNEHSFDGENNHVTSSSPSLDVNELNKRLCNKFNIDVNDLNLCSNYEEQLKMNDINENLDVILSETFNKLSTSSEKDGYWCFKRKEGCKYLAAQNSGSIFKNDPIEFYENTRLNNSSIYDCTKNDSTVKKVKENNQFSFLNSVSLKNRLKNLQYYYYGYAITKRNRHLGLVRRRVGRGGRILFDKYNQHYNLFKNNKDTNKNSINDINDSLNKFKTFYPKDCFILKSPECKNNNNDETLISPSTSSPNNMAVVPVKDKSKKKLFLKKLKQTADKDFCFSSEDKKNYSNNSSSEEDEDLNENSMLENDKLVYDYRLFPLYQLNRIENKESKAIDNNTIINDKKDNLSCFQNVEDNINNDTIISNRVLLNDSPCEINNQDDKDSKNDTGTNFIKLDLTPSNNLNSEYYFKSNKYNITMPNLKFAIKTLCVPKIVTDNGMKKKLNEKINNENYKNHQNDLQNFKDVKNEIENVNITSFTENICKITNEKDKKNEHKELKDSASKPLLNGINNSISALQAALLARKQFSNNSNANILLNDNSNSNNNSAKKNSYDSNAIVSNNNLTSTSSVPSSSSSSSLSSPTVTKFINNGTDNSALPINGINGIGTTIFKSKLIEIIIINL
jgi:hypothetical protein